MFGELLLKVQYPRFSHTAKLAGVLFAIALIIIAGSLVPAGTVSAAPLSGCTNYTNIRAVDEGGGTWNDRHYYLYVYGTTVGGGQTYYRFVASSGGTIIYTWMYTGWSAVGLTSDRKALKIGVSTFWAYTHPGWQNMTYKYVLC